MPETAKLDLILNRKPLPKLDVMERWKRAARLLARDVPQRGWLAEVLKAVEEQFSTFTLQDLYTNCEEELQGKHPENHNVRPKIRQQLQYLRNLGFVRFVRPGVYSIVRAERI